MELNYLNICVLLTVFINNFICVHPNHPIVNLLSNDLLEKNPVLSLAQLLLTAKLVKDYNNNINGNSDDPKTNYMLFLGKGNIQFQNHNLEAFENITEATDYETTTESYEDLAKNKHLLKFVARNGYDVWKRLLEVPPNEDMSENTTDSTLTPITETIDPTIDPFSVESKRLKYNKKMVKKLKQLYKPDIQMIETKKGFIKHEVKPPKWVKDIIDSDQKSQKNSKVKRVSINNMAKNSYKKNSTNIVKNHKKAVNRNGFVRNEKVYKNVETVPKQKKFVVKITKPVQKDNNRIGNVVIKGFNSLIRGFGSLLGLDTNP